MCNRRYLWSPFTTITHTEVSAVSTVPRQWRSSSSILCSSPLYSRELCICFAVCLVNLHSHSNRVLQLFSPPRPSSEFDSPLAFSPAIPLHCIGPPQLPPPPHHHPTHTLHCHIAQLNHSLHCCDSCSFGLANPNKINQVT